MAHIKVSDLSFSYPGSYIEIFRNVSFQIDTDWKLGFVGRNGRGKRRFCIYSRENIHTREQFIRRLITSISLIP